MNTEDVKISNISYTSKDFATMYPEILDLAKQLTNRWDPSHSNESDPGVVLLKEAAFVADHNNYNIDKNILENFLPSATQDRSVRNICEMNGYVPRYYVSAAGELKLKWKPENSEDEEQLSLPSSFTVPAFTFVVSDANESLAYTQITDMTFVNGECTSNNTFMEGTLQSLNVNNSNVILLDNLDDNNRVYFPDTLVAENGIYVKYATQSEHKQYGYWKKDNYPLTQPAGSRIYKVDFDSNKGLPYVEFPSDISNMIGDGLNIDYISTSGGNGNVSAGTLVKVLSPSSFIDMQGYERKSESFIVSNSSSITNGKDPETINEMYKSFKKVVGTFDTLVSCKDYADKVFIDCDELVSNVYVTDRRNDYNKALNVIDHDSFGNFFTNISLSKSALVYKGEGAPTSDEVGHIYYNDGKLRVFKSANEFIDLDIDKDISLNDFVSLSESMNPFDLVIYALAAFSMSDYSSSVPNKALSKSFLPVENNNTTNVRRLIYDEIENNKCINHTYKAPGGNDIYCFKNYAPITAKIKTYQKVESLKEKNEIINNICRAISQKFNPRELEFGEKLDDDYVKEVIINSDDRIQSVSEYSYNYELYATQYDGSTGKWKDNVVNPENNASIIIDLIAKNVLAGRVCLFEFDDDFNYAYGQYNDGSIIGKVKNINKISSEVLIPIDDSGDHSKEVTQEKITSWTSYLESMFDGESWNINYCLYAPHLCKSDGTPLDLTYPNSYTLQSGDSLQIELNGELIADIVGGADPNKSYMITNNLNDDNIIKNSEKIGKLSPLESTGRFLVTEDTSITTIAEQTISVDYTLNENECIQIISPNYYSDRVYSSYVSYRFQAANGTHIYANTDHTLLNGEKLILQYTSDNVSKTDFINEGEVINCSFDLYPTDTYATGVTKKVWTDEYGVVYNSAFKSLASSETIAVRKLMKTVLDSSNLKCYWSVDNQENFLFRATGNQEIILGDDEYFVYADSLMNEMMILGAGTKLKRNDINDAQWKLKDDDKISIESLSDEGFSIDIPWQTIDFREYNFEIIEMNVITLGEGDNVQIFGWTDHTEDNINNAWQKCNGTITYKIDNDDKNAVTLPTVDEFYQIRSRLDVVMSKNKPQKVYENQTITIDGATYKYDDDNKYVYIQSSDDLSILGGDNCNISLYNNLGTYAYFKIDSSNKVISIENSGGATYPLYYFKDNKYILPIYISGDEITIKAEIRDESGNNIYFKDYNAESSAGTELVMKGNVGYYLHIDKEYDSEKLDNDQELYLYLSWEVPEGGLASAETIFVDDFRCYTGINEKLFPSLAGEGETKEELKKAKLNDINNRIRTLISNSDRPSIKPYYTYKIDNSIALNNCNFEDPNVMWDVNNVANMMTLPQIDLAKCDFDIDQYMKGYEE